MARIKGWDKVKETKKSIMWQNKDIKMTVIFIDDLTWFYVRKLYPSNLDENWTDESFYKFKEKEEALNFARDIMKTESKLYYPSIKKGEKPLRKIKGKQMSNKRRK